MKLLITTLGDFDISIDKQSLLKKSGRSYKLIKLFQYFITFRGRKLLPETIIENLWQDNDYSDPKNVLRTQIFRLRQTIKGLPINDIDESQYINISFNNGYYCFELGEEAILDIEEFEKYISHGDRKKPKDADEAIELYKKAIKLYKGLYLSENSYETWLVPVRNHYRRLYLKTFFKLMDMLNEREEYSSVIELCEEAILIEPYEEALHIYMLEAMLKTGQIKSAMSHYEYITFLLKSEMGINSSSGLRNIHKKILGYYDKKGETNIKNIITKLEEDSRNGALMCDSDYFRFLYNIVRRKGLREKRTDYMSLITMSFKDQKKLRKGELKKLVKIMSNVLKHSLRKGDVYSFWNDTQILVMLHGAKEDSLEKIKMRIKNNFESNASSNLCRISIEFMPLTSEYEKCISC